MIRAFLVLAAILIAVLAFVFERPWLYAVAGVPLVGLLGLLSWRLWATYRHSAGRPSAEPFGDVTDDSLEDLGIMEVRPQEEADSTESSEETSAAKTDRSAADDPSHRSSSARSSASASSPTAQSGPEAIRSVPGEENGVSSGASSVPTTSDPFEESPVLGPFLESLRAALEAHTVCLLVQEEVVLEYRIEAIASTRPDVRRDGSFETRDPLLTATMSRQPVTVRTVDHDSTLDDLGYYEKRPTVDQVAVAPVRRPNDAATYFVIVDAPAASNLGGSRARTLLEEYTGVLQLLLADGRKEATEQQIDGKTSDAAGASTAGANSTDEATEKPRPRREIIAEEMRATDAADEELALVLVHLNRAESISRQGEDAVASAERLLRARLQQAAPKQRVERFGELTFGVFYRGGIDDVEPWAADLQGALGEETGVLEGGVSVGVALRTERHDPEALRADATEALREAYETGTCTIVA